MIELVRILVEAGATPASAARAAVVLEGGGSIREAEAELVLEPAPASFAVEAMVAALEREHELVERKPRGAH